MFNIKKLQSAKQGIYVFHKILTINTIISLHSTKWLVFNMETNCVLCEAGTSVLYII